MRVGFRKLGKLRLIVDLCVLDSETTDAFACICLNIGDAVDFCQIASDRGGTAPSRHVRHFKGD